MIEWQKRFREQQVNDLSNKKQETTHRSILERINVGTQEIEVSVIFETASFKPFFFHFINLSQTSLYLSFLSYTENRSLTLFRTCKSSEGVFVCLDVITAKGSHDKRTKFFVVSFLSLML